MNINLINLFYSDEITVNYSSKVLGAMIQTSKDAYDLILTSWTDMEYTESFYVILLNPRNKVLGVCKISIGGLAGIVTETKKIFQTALKANIARAILFIITLINSYLITYVFDTDIITINQVPLKMKSEGGSSSYTLSYNSLSLFGDLVPAWYIRHNSSSIWESSCFLASSSVIIIWSFNTNYGNFCLLWCNIRKSFFKYISPVKKHLQILLCKCLIFWWAILDSN